MSLGNLIGKTAIVTGSSAGIGRAIADGLVTAGAEVVVTARTADRARDAVAAIEATGGRAHPAVFDATADFGELRAFCAEATGLLGGRVDILVNNAGVYPGGPSEDLSDADLQDLLNANIRAPHVLVSTLVPRMLNRGSGVIVNVTSFTTRFGAAHGALYPATKAAVEQLTKGWAAEYGPRGIRVNAVSPGVVPSPGNADSRDAISAIGANTPAGIPVPDTAIADAVVFLSADSGTFLHGTTIDVDGGIGAVRALL